MKLPNLATERNRWFALIFLALGLAIVIIDNTVLNVAIPYILRDLNTSLDALQWVISGYALIIATLLITVGRLGDMYGRKKIFLIGAVFFATGSLIASFANNPYLLFLGEAVIEAVGAAMMLTSSLSLVVSEFHGKERALAFGIWGSVAGVSASVGPLLGGYLTTYYSWRWSLRINVAVALIAILGSVFIKEAKGHGKKEFDWLGTLFSGVGFFSLVFAMIEGQKYGWWTPKEVFTLFGWTWPLTTISIIPFALILAVVSLILFILTELVLEERGRSPLMRPSLFRHSGFSLGLATLGIVSLGQFGVFFIMPIYLQGVLGLDALKTGIVFLSSSVSVAVFGPLSGFIASKIGPKWLTVAGMFAVGIGTFMLSRAASATATGWSLAPSLAVFGMGIGMSSAQLTNITLSSVPVHDAGEASASNQTVRQVGTSIGIAIIGAVLATNVASNIVSNIQKDTTIPPIAKAHITASLKNVSVERGQQSIPKNNGSPALGQAIKNDVEAAMVDASKTALQMALFFILPGALLSLFIPTGGAPISSQEMLKREAVGEKEEGWESNVVPGSA